MAFVDVTVPNLYGGAVSAQVGGAPQGGGIVGQGVSVGRVAPGSQAWGTNAQVRHWIFGFYAFIAFTLVSAGLIFNGK